MEDLLTVKEVAAKLKVTERAVLDWLRAGQLRGLRAGKKWRIREADLDAFLQTPYEAPKRRRKPTAPAKAKRQR